jgi:hypothetical protein
MAVVVNLIPSDEPIKIKVGSAAVKPTPSVKLELNIRKSLNGDLMIFDHADIDIVMSARTSKITAFPKETMSDMTYGAQNRLFNYLRKKGIIVAESIQGGSYYGAIEGSLQEAYDDKINSAKFALINISKFIEEERPYFENVEAIVAGVDDDFIEPDKADSTELGEVPQQVQQGSLRPGYVRDPYRYSYMYTI